MYNGINGKRSPIATKDKRNMYSGIKGKRLPTAKTDVCETQMPPRVAYSINSHDYVKAFEN
jgi:hypothetical protein